MRERQESNNRRALKITFISAQITTSVPHLPAWVPGEFFLLEASNGKRRERDLSLVAGFKSEVVSDMTCESYHFSGALSP